MSRIGHECATTALAKTARNVTAEALRRGSIRAVAQPSLARTTAMTLPHASEGKHLWKVAEATSAVQSWTVPGSLDPYLVNARADFEITKIEKAGALFAKTHIAHLPSVPVPPTLLAKRHAPVLHLPEQTPPSTANRVARDEERSRKQRSKSPDLGHLALPVRPTSANSRPTSANSFGKGHRTRVTADNHHTIMQHMPVFADAEAMKEKVRQAIGEKEPHPFFLGAFGPFCFFLGVISSGSGYQQESSSVGVAELRHLLPPEARRPQPMEPNP